MQVSDDRFQAELGWNWYYNYVRCNEGSFILHVLSYHDSPLLRLIIFGVCILYVYFVVTSTGFLGIVFFI